MIDHLDGVLWLLLLLGPLLFLQIRLHREVQGILLLLTRRIDVVTILFSLLFFPGVILHEFSHYVVARLLGVRTGRFSLLPRPLKNGRLQLGFVETATTDFLRDALIGAAPLFLGTLFVAYSGMARLELHLLWKAIAEGDSAGFMNLLSHIYTHPDFWLWFYLTFAVSSTMLPSASDRRAWLPLGIVLIAIVGTSLLIGAGPWLSTKLAPLLNNALRALAAVLGISLAVHLVLLPPAWGLRKLLSRLMGYSVVS